MANFIGSIDLRATRVPIAIPFVIVGAIEIVQLFLGTPPLLAFLSMAGILVTLLPLHFNGRDLFSLCAMTVGLRYLGIALILKTLYHQPLQTNLFDPIGSYAWVFVIMVVYTGVILLARRLDLGVDTFAFPNDPESLRRLALVSFAIGFVCMAFLAQKSSDNAGSGSLSIGGFGIVAATLQNLLILAFVAEASRSLEVTNGRNLFSPVLIGMFVVVFIAVSSLNFRGFFINMVIGVALVGFIYKAIRVQYIIAGLMFLVVFTTFVTPVVLFTRAQRALPLTQFIQYSLETGYRAATDGEFLKYVQATASGRSDDPSNVEYDYYGDRSNVGNRLSYVALFDAIYQASKGVDSLGFKVVKQSLTGVTPGFLGIDKNPESLGDWLGWQIGIVDEGDQPFINYGLSMEGYTAWGWIGIIIYPIVFILPYLLVFSRVASFRLAVPLSIFVFCQVQPLMIESTSDGLLNAMTRAAVILAVFLFILRYFFPRAQTRPPTVPATAQI